MVRKNRTRDIALVGIMGALMALVSLINIPGPMGLPITLQTFAAAFCGALLGWRRGVGAVGVYVALGCLGLPVFSQFGAGIGHLLAPTGGFIWGFLILALCCGLGSAQKRNRIICSAIGLLLNYVTGILQFVLIMNDTNGLWWLLPYFLKDVFLVSVAISVAARIKRSFAELIY